MEETLDISKLEKLAFEKYSNASYCYRVYQETSVLGKEDLIAKIQEVVNSAETLYNHIEEELKGVKGDDADRIRASISDYRSKLETIKNGCGLESTEPNA